MSPLFDIENELQSCRDQLEERGRRSSKFDVDFFRKPNKDGSLGFRVRRVDSTFKAASPRFSGQLSPKESKTQLSRKMNDGNGGTTFITLWCFGATFIGAIAIMAVLVLLLRTRAEGYVDEPSLIGIIPLIFALAGLVVASIAEEVQRREPKELLNWLQECFDHQMDEASVETIGAVDNKIVLPTLTKQLLKLGTAGLIIGVVLGFVADIEDNLEPLRIEISDFHTCTTSGSGSTLIRKESFTSTEVIYGCGHLAIEIIDHRPIEIPLWLRWDSQADENQSGYISREVNSSGEFALRIKAPPKEGYPVGSYTLTLGHIKQRYGTIEFEVVDRQ